MPRERADSDYCLLVQPAVIGLQRVDCYCQPKMEFTNANAAFCLMCVVNHYSLNMSAI